MTSYDTYLTIANLIASTHMTYLTDAQMSYVKAGCAQLPKWARDCLNDVAEGKVPSDEYVQIMHLRRTKALEIARGLFDIDVLTLTQKPIKELLELADASTNDSIDDSIKKICERKVAEFRDPYHTNEVSLAGFREELAEASSRAVYDCDKLLADVAYAGELASFRRAIIRNFPYRHWDANPVSYRQALNTILKIAQEDAEGNRHYANVVNESIGAFLNAMTQSHYQGAKTSRKHILFDSLRIDATPQDIGWALDVDWIELSESMPVCNPETRRELLQLGFITMGDLKGPVGNIPAHVVAKIAKTLEIVAAAR